jgi:carbamoylphosphate synthase large subunit
MANGFGSLIPKMGKPLMYPYIVKTSIDEGGKTCQVIANSQQEDAVSEAFVPPEYFAQEFIAGPLEYALHAIFKDQDIRCSMNVEYAFGTGTPIKGREKITYTKICHCPYLDLFSSIVLSIGFQGLCCINYKVLDGRPFLIEINPRFGSSLRSYFLSFVRHLE